LSHAIELEQPDASRQFYAAWVEEQIEEYKDTVTRSDLLQLAEDVIEELKMNQRGQYQLTELLLWAAVDRRIFLLLDLPEYASWCGVRYAPFQERKILPLP